MKLEFVPTLSIDAAPKNVLTPSGIAFVVSDKRKLSTLARQVDKATGGQLQRALDTGGFAGKNGQVISFLAPPAWAYDFVLIGAIGNEKTATFTTFEDLGGHFVKEAHRLGLKSLIISAEPTGAKIDNAEAAARVLLGARLRSYRFDKYRTKEKPEDKPKLEYFALAGLDVKTAKAAYLPLEAIAVGVTTTRDIVSEPPNIMYPEAMAEVCRSLSQYGLKVEVLGEAEMEKLGMGSILGVGQGSVRESKIAILRWNGGAKGEPPVAFVGKGVTFDSGGISIKPAKGMDEMKWDMGGAGTVIGLMQALAMRKAKVNAIGAVGLVENMPDGNAQRPGDVVTSMSGQTIEVLNTDAEGRLVLADVLWYVQDKFKPKFMINLATLTGAIIVAIGSERAGLFSNNDQLAERLFKVGEEVNEKLWRFPLDEAYDKQINSDIADMQNIGAEREAGSIMGAVFLQRFVNGVPWAHLDIAGTAWTRKDKPTVPKGATAFGIRLLDRLVQEYYEK